MMYLVAILIILGFIAAIVGYISQRHGNEEQIIAPLNSSCATCNGNDPKCEQECMMEAATKDIEYYDDEELDRYKGRPSNQYTDDEAEDFAEVMNTMKPEEATGWNRSLILRGINIPDQIKDELIMIIGNS